MTKETSSKTYLKQHNIGTSLSDDLAELQYSLTEKRNRNISNNERHTDYELKAANKTFRNTGQDENNSTSDTNNKETFNPKPLSLNEGRQHFLEDIFKHLSMEGQQERTQPVPSSRPQGFRGLSLSGSNTKAPEEQTTTAKEKTKEQTTIENQGTEPPQKTMEERRSQTPGFEQSYSGYRVPKPHTFTGKGDNEDGTAIDSWIREVKSHFNLAKTPEKDHPETLQFWLEGRAKDFYWAKRLPLLAKGKDLNLNEFLTQLRKHIVPATEESRKWDKWNNINRSSQMERFRR
jgi:hypothetical protein